MGDMADLENEMMERNMTEEEWEERARTDPRIWIPLMVTKRKMAREEAGSDAQS
jgi:hypothetical protein